MNAPPTTTHHGQMLAAALAYAAQGRYIVPLHAPIFDASGGPAIGCTCEAYKRSDRYRTWLDSKGRGSKFDPQFTCEKRMRGKHPRLSDWEGKASTDPATIRAWFAKWPDQMNIGIAAGKSGLLVLDEDNYKENYAGDDLLATEDQNTPTQRTHSGGAHLVFAMPPGKSYGNHNRGLPTGIDVRGNGGFNVVYPSIGYTGRAYEWKPGLSIFDMAPRPLPPALVDLLDAAQASGPQAQTFKHTATEIDTPFISPTTPAPDLAQWRTSPAIRALIDSPAASGQRSEADYKVCLSLVYAGATNDDILSIFEHTPIGTDGKFAEKGPRYLALTIGNARAFADAHPRPQATGPQARPDISATLAPIRLWIRKHSFAAFVPPSPDGIYRTDVTDTKVADAILDAMAEAGRLDIVIGKKRLGKLAGTSCNTALKALERLQDFLFVVAPDPFGARVTLAENPRFAWIDPSKIPDHVIKRDQSTRNDNFPNDYSPRKATDPFLSGTSHTVRAQMRDVAAALDITQKEALAQFTSKGLGETALRVLDAMGRIGYGTADDLADETGKKLGSIRRACHQLEQHNLLESVRYGSTGPKVYTLIDDHWARVDAIAPHLRTYHLTAERENKRLERAQAWTRSGFDTALDAGDTAQAEKMSARFTRQANQRVPYLAQIYPDLPLDAIERHALDVQAYKQRPPARPPAPPPPTRWAFVRDVTGIRADLELSAKPGANWRKEAYWLASYLDGKEDDHTEAVRVAMGMGVYYPYGVDWVGLRAET